MGNSQSAFVGMFAIIGAGVVAGKSIQAFVSWLGTDTAFEVIPEALTLRNHESVGDSVRELQHKMGIDPKNFLNFAVVGQAGAGKSALINGLRGLYDSDDLAAPVGATETTSKMTKYQVPNVRKICLWDIPGAGTSVNPLETYYEDKCLYAFGHLLIVVGNRMNEIDLKIARKAKENKVPVSFVRSKLDADVSSQNGRVKKTSEEMAAGIRQYLIEELKKNGFGDCSECVYVISGRAYVEH